MAVRDDRLIGLIESGGGPGAASLRQDARHFDRLSTVEAERLRGRILAALGRSGVPDDALPAIREELRTSLSPVVLAGAARALRSLENADGELRALLGEASERISLHDEYVTFDDERPLTARQEIAAALAHLDRPRRPCCGGAAAAPLRGTEAPSFPLSSPALERVVVEDQSGARSPLVPLLRGRTSLVAFFYTRCTNPAKCSLTITRLADHVRRAAAGSGVLAFTYDSRFDTPARLRAYGQARGFEFGERARLVRCASGWKGVREAFRLQVGYGEATVNEHARELFAVGPDLEARGLDPEILADPDRLEHALAASG